MKNCKGVSLPVITGLLTLLMISSAAANTLIIRSLQSVKRIESANRAYLAAESGMEDALYELSVRLPGYQTPDINSDDARSFSFVEPDEPLWNNKWQIEGINKENNTYNGIFYPDRKIYVYLHRDDSGTTPLNSGSVNNVMPTDSDINTTGTTGNLNISFAIPEDFISYDSAGDTALNVIKTGASLFNIDNDWDNKANEDPPDGKDNDNDGKYDEDGNDPIILWKLVDGKGNSLNPKKGCLKDINPGSMICENDFQRTTGFKVNLTKGTHGIDQNGTEKTIDSFITTNCNSNAKCQFEFIVVSPLVHTYNWGGGSVDIPFLDYKIEINAQNAEIVKPYFTIKSDGFHGDSKQSITTTVMPKTTVPLFDFTIIQTE